MPSARFGGHVNALTHADHMDAARRGIIDVRDRRQYDGNRGWQKFAGRLIIEFDVYKIYILPCVVVCVCVCLVCVVFVVGLHFGVAMTAARSVAVLALNTGRTKINYSRSFILKK